MSSIGEMIHKRRQELGMSQAELARRSGLTAAAISQFEAGTRRPRYDALRKLSRALGVSLDYIAGDKVAKDIQDALADPRMQAITRSFVEMSDDERQQLYDFFQFLQFKRQQQKKRD